jgi:hypothetical protein
MFSRRFSRVAVGALALTSAGTLLVAGGGQGPAAAAAPALAFSHMVVVDQQRPGFEPDVKVAPNGTIYSSFPFGFSSTQSFLYSSPDHGNSYQLTPGNLAGKPATCVGGGDTDLFIDRGGALYFSDLQGLSNISQSRSTDGGATFATNCAGVPNTPDDRMWFAGTGSRAAGTLNLFEDFDQVGSAASPAGGNQLVETISHDGITFQPVLNAAAATQCPGTATDCVTNNEGISGNQVVDPKTGNIYIAHTALNGSNGTPGVAVSEGKVTVGTPTTATWTESPNLDAALCPHPSCVRPSGTAEALAGENFATIAQDTAGYLYVTFTEGPVNASGALTSPEKIYVVHSLAPAAANPSAVQWSAPKVVSGAGTNTFPWLVAGSDGRVDVAWYHTPTTSHAGAFGAANLTNAEWSVQLGQSLNAHGPSPSYTDATVTEHPVKHGQICTNGLGCATGGDRSLGDYLQVSIDGQGAALVSYVDDTSQDTAAGENAGPEEISRQIGGSSLLASVGTIAGPGPGPGRPTGSVTDPTGDGDYSANGSRTAATPNLDVVGASLADQPSSERLNATIKVRNLSSLTVPATLGGPDASWMLRWTAVQPGTTGNGHIYYVGMDNNATSGGKPTFFVGDTSCIPGPGNPAEHCKYLTYPQTHPLTAKQASYDPATGVITFHIPEALVGDPETPVAYYSATAFSATSTQPQSATTLFNLIDASTPFDVPNVN